MKYRIQNTNPACGLLLSLGIVSSLIPYLYGVEQWRGMLFITGLLLISIDLILIARQFQKKLEIKDNGDIEIETEKKRVFAHPYKVIYFWGYNDFELPFPVIKLSGSSGYKKSGRIRVCLNILLEDANGQKVRLFQNLPPWKETPKGWDYQILDDDNIERVKIFNSEKLLTDLKQYRWK